MGDEVRLDNDHHDHDDSASVKKRRKGKAAAAITVPRPPPSPTFEEKKLIHLEILRDFDLKTKVQAISSYWGIFSPPISLYSLELVLVSHD